MRELSKLLIESVDEESVRVIIDNCADDYDDIEIIYMNGNKLRYTVEYEGASAETIRLWKSTDEEEPEIVSAAKLWEEMQIYTGKPLQLTLNLQLASDIYESCEEIV